MHAACRCMSAAATPISSAYYEAAASDAFAPAARVRRAVVAVVRRLGVRAVVLRVGVVLRVVVLRADEAAGVLALPFAAAVLARVRRAGEAVPSCVVAPRAARFSARSRARSASGWRWPTTRGSPSSAPATTAPHW